MTLPGHQWRRRDALRLFATASGLMAAGVWRATASIASPTVLAQTSGAAACALTAEQEEGPFYVDLDLVRSDVREDQVGIPLNLTMTVLDMNTCQPLPNAAVDIWSANALGVYSAEAQLGSSGATFLRGLQITGADGTIQFTTLYPGWYTGRVNHIHMKVHVGGAATSASFDETGSHVAHTGQMFFPQDVNDAIAKISPYTSNRNAYVSNSQDGVYTSQSGSLSQLALTGNPSDGFSGSITLSVDPDATPAGVGAGGAAPGGTGRRGFGGPPPQPAP
ncbi:MAG: intradiol ring-cleavage dioxygenase [Chloroflexi bacterium]|nr:intradiol ring-cleavage dioxygenase [Chloroflexota bacterium]